MLLHTVNKSPFEKNSLESCLRIARQGDSILLFEDGIYAALKGTRFEKLLTEAIKSYNIYVLKPDLEARGMIPEKKVTDDGKVIEEDVIEGIKPIDYADFVDLVAENKTVQAWL